VVTWRGRYAEHGLPGLEDLPRPGKPAQPAGRWWAGSHFAMPNSPCGHQRTQN